MFVYRMSTIGTCVQALSAFRLGAVRPDAPEYLELAAKESRRHEQWIMDELRAEGYIVATCSICRQCRAEGGIEREGIHAEIRHPMFRVVGHLDAVIIEEMPLMGALLDEKIPEIAELEVLKAHFLEVKALSRYRFAAWKQHGWDAFPTFRDQFTAYWEATKTFCTPPNVFVVKCRDTGEKDIVNVEEPPGDIDEIIERLTWVEGNARAGVQVSCDQERGSPLTKYCWAEDCPYKPKEK